MSCNSESDDEYDAELQMLRNNVLMTLKRKRDCLELPKHSMPPTVPESELANSN